MTDIQSPGISLRNRLEDLALAAVLRAVLCLPYARRVAAMGWVARHLLGPVAGVPRRIRANLAHVWPDMPAPQVARLMRAVPDNIGRTMAELFSGRDFVERVAGLPLSGPGVAALEQARAARRPVILMTAHLGNYDALRAALLARGFPVGGLYMPMENPAFNRRYVAAISAIGTPLFPRGREGLAGMIRFLRQGGMLGMVADHYMAHGEVLTFMGRPARTALSGAEMALKYDALLVPAYGLRRADGLSFDLIIESPIPHSDPVTMTQAVNDSAEAMVRAHPEQWLWSHRRWKDAG
jgi:KDO2-lipid IV(A) lauroyltransferase